MVRPLSVTKRGTQIAPYATRVVFDVDGVVEKGILLVAGTNDRLSLRSDFTLHYTKEPIDYPYRPSVNVFFNSLAQYWNNKATAVLYQLR